MSTFFRNCTFENFHRDDLTAPAISLAKQFCELSEAPNPLVIATTPGFGKTHLLHAIANRIRSRHSRISITMPDCTSHLDSFSGFGTTSDVILIDDFSKLLGNEKALEQAIVSLTEALTSGRKIAVTVTARSERDLEQLPELLTRHPGALVATIFGDESKEDAIARQDTLPQPPKAQPRKRTRTKTPVSVITPAASA